MNKLYLISYDLMAPGKDYSRLFDALAKINARRLLLSDWLVKSPSTALDLRDYVKGYIDQNDRVFVAEVVPSNWTGYSLLFDPNNL